MIAASGPRARISENMHARVEGPGSGACRVAAGVRRVNEGPGTRVRAAFDAMDAFCQQLQVLQQLGKGLVYKEIAYELGLSPSTIRSHLHNVYRKLGVANRAQAVLFATGRGWL
jgi:DNA-binding NarL/FixJ family response regulator